MFEVNNMERHVNTTYRLHDWHICAWDWCITLTYNLYTNDELYVWRFRSWVLSLLTTSLECPSFKGATVHKPRRRAATLPFLWKTFQGSVSVSTGKVVAGGKDWRLFKKIYLVHRLSRLCYHPSWCVVSPNPQLCWDSSRRQYWWRFRRFRWLGAVFFAMLFCRSLCYRHCC